LSNLLLRRLTILLKLRIRAIGWLSSLRILMIDFVETFPGRYKLRVLDLYLGSKGAIGTLFLFFGCRGRLFISRMLIATEI
jgi:hypothetical protein